MPPRNMRLASIRPTLFVAILMMTVSLTGMGSSILFEEAEAASGIDVIPTGFDMTYVSSTDQNQYALLSSHDPSNSGFTRPLDLYVIDGMRNVSSQIEITVQNIGSSPSGSFQMRLVVLHNEYSGFEILNTTLTLNSINGGSSTTVSHTWAPKYGGNHTLVATTLHNTDDNNANDIFTRSLAIGQYYFNCDTSGTGTGSWSLAPGWTVDSSISLSGSSFNVGSGGTSSSYGANWDRSLTSPIFDYSNAHQSPNNYAKLGFFYTGSVASGDGIRLEFRDTSSNSWVNLVNNGFSFTASPDTNLNDGVSWLIQNEANGPGTSPSLDPGMIIPTQTLHQQTQFRFRFISDNSDNAQGYWLDDMVIIYEEKAWPEEYKVQMTNNGQDSHARRGHWADHVVTIQNDGNITDQFTPSISGLPNDWDYQFVHMSGSTILPSMSLELEPGESLSFRVQIKPGPNSLVGSQQSTVSITSDNHAPSSASVTINTVVDPDYIPKWEAVPNTYYCLPGNSCEFSINLSNIGDGSDTFAITSTPVIQWENWTFDISFNQPPTVTIPSGSNAVVLLQADIPISGLPGQKASIDVIAISQADNTVSDTIRVNLTASMISNSGVGVAEQDIPDDGWWVEPNESVIIPFTVWNNATSQDTFDFNLDESNMRGWNASLPSSTTLVVRSGETGRILVTLHAPTNAQSGDPAPILIPIVTSTISGTPATANPFSGIRVTMMHDLILRNNSNTNTISPGENTYVSFEVENAGNGPEHAIVDITGIPSTWEYHIEVDGVLLSGPISLSPSYEGNHIVDFEFVFSAPGGEEANVELEIDVSVRPTEGLDLNEEDNSFTINARTDRITRPVLDIDNEFLEVRTDSLSLVTLTLMNDGNSVDGSMRIRIVADTILPGISSTLSNGGQSLGLNQWFDTPLPPQQELSLQWLIEVASDVPVGTNITFTLTFEASDDNHGNSQTINRTVILSVTSHRELIFTHSLSEATTLEPEQRMIFKVNATSYSSFTEELVLEFTGADVWSVICDNQENSNFEWVKVMPSTNDPDGRRATWNCELTAPKNSELTNLNIVVTTENEIMWESETDLIVKSVEVEDGGISLGFGTSSQELSLIIGSVGLLFLIFVVGMIVAINKKKRARDEYDDEEDEAEDNNVVVQPAPQVQYTQTPVQQAPIAQTQPSSFTDEQFRAAGWTDDKIQEYRRQEATEQAEAIAAQQVVTNQNAFAAQMQQQHSQSQTQQPAPQQQEGQSQLGSNLDSAFGSLGISTELESEEKPTLDTATALAAFDSNQETPISNEGQSLPKVNCGYCDQHLTLDDQWIECPDCGIYSHSTCKEGKDSCARCGSKN
ncbi:MAG: hypothetical protein CMA77_01410 [Euryarchaeota archaeon]|nr:hypothetical protein [Euryarchaeota archaeon]